MSEGNFWRGYWPLLIALGTTQLTQQVDIVMMGRLGGGASGAYVMLMRLAVADLVLMTAMAAVASTSVTQVQLSDERGRVIGWILSFAAITGFCCCSFGLLLYPFLAKWIAGDGEVAALISTSVFWYSLAAPFRFLSVISAFILQALGEGALVVRWKMTELFAKVAGNFLIMEIFGLGFSGCFITGSIIAVVSSIWCLHKLMLHDVRIILVPEYSWALQFFRSTLWESQRIIAVQLAVLGCLALFAAPWLGKYDISRLNSYAAGQTMMLVIFAPFAAMMRFLAFRFAALREDRLAAAMQAIWRQGAPVVIGATLILLASEEKLGRLYGQQGPWWTTLVHVLATSLPLRYVTNVLRAYLQSQSAFAAVATADTGAFLLLATPLVAIGLYADSPLIAYLSLIVPEAASGIWLYSRLQSTRGGDLVNAGVWPLRFR